MQIVFGLIAYQLLTFADTVVKGRFLPYNVVGCKHKIVLNRSFYSCASFELTLLLIMLYFIMVEDIALYSLGLKFVDGVHAACVNFRHLFPEEYLYKNYCIFVEILMIEQQVSSYFCCHSFSSVMKVICCLLCKMWQNLCISVVVL